MSWFRVDDRSAFHSKVLAAGNEGWGALCRAGAWTSGELRDGWFPFTVAQTIAKKPVWTRLVDAGLLTVEADGYRIHDFLQWNPSAEEVRAERDRKARNVAEFRRRRSEQQEAPATGHVTGYATGNVTGNAPGNEPAVNRVPIPIPIPEEEHTHTARAGTLAREDREPMSREAGEVLAALRAHPALSAVADVRFAETLDGRRAGKPVAWLAQAIADAAADTPQGETVQAVQRRVRAYCDRARSPAEAAARVVPFARPPTGQAAQPITPEGTGWKQNLDERQAAHIAAMIAAGKDAPL